KVKRAQGFAWEFRYYVMEGSVRKPKVQTFDSAIYKTEKALRQHLESFVVKLNEKTEGLQWSDIDWEKQTVSIRRSAYRGAIDDTKNNSSKAKLPLHPTLATLLLAWKIKWSEREEEMQRRAALRKRKRPLKKNEFGWLFANPNTGMPYMSPSLQQRWIRPAGEAIGLEGLGFHSLRHSYRTWLDSAGAAAGGAND